MFKKIWDTIKGIAKGRGPRRRRGRPRRNPEVNSNGSNVAPVYESASFGSLITDDAKKERRRRPEHKRKSSTFTTASEKGKSKSANSQRSRSKTSMTM